MPIEDAVRTRIAQLLQESGSLSIGNEHDQCVDERQQRACAAWLTAAHNAVHLVCPSATTPYRLLADKIATTGHGYGIHNAVGTFAAILKSLVGDADAGLLASVADRATAEAFDDFLDHADAYFRDGRKNESGVIAGVVFEDSVRRICRKGGISEKGQNLDSLISALSSTGDLSGVKAKRARAAAHVRTKASHAQWDEFELEDVRATIEFTRELIATKLDA